MFLNMCKQNLCFSTHKLVFFNTTATRLTSVVWKGRIRNQSVMHLMKVTKPNTDLISKEKVATRVLHPRPKNQVLRSVLGTPAIQN